MVVIERPYFTDIFPEVFSAMSYDPLRSGPAPATAGAASLLVGLSSLAETHLEEWFRDSWGYMRSGAVVLNVCFRYKFMEPQAQQEKLEFQRLLRAIAVESMDDSSTKGRW